MAPEYALEGSFSIKSDVYSFGILMLKIISGKKNRGDYHSECGQNLLTYVSFFFVLNLLRAANMKFISDAELHQICSLTGVAALE